MKILDIFIFKSRAYQNLLRETNRLRAHNDKLLHEKKIAQDKYAKFKGSVHSAIGKIQERM